MVWITTIGVLVYIFPVEIYMITKTTWNVSKYVYKIISNNLGSTSKKQHDE